MKEDMTLEEAGKCLREFAEMTAKASRNWDAYQSIATDMIRQAFAGGKAAAEKTRSNP